MPMEDIRSSTFQTFAVRRVGNVLSHQALLNGINGSCIHCYVHKGLPILKIITFSGIHCDRCKGPQNSHLELCFP